MKCPHCGLLNPETAQRCDCGYDFQKKTIEKTYPAATAAQVASAVGSPSPAGLSTRYSDAYLVARATVRIGRTVKVLAILFGIVVALVLTLYAVNTNQSITNQSFQATIFGAILLVVMVCVPLYILGILVSAIGQILQASLDTAVNTSTFLKNDEKARVMSL